MIAWLALALLLLAAPAWAQVSSQDSAQDVIYPPGFILKDEGTSQGRVQELNCVGAGIVCSRSAKTGTLSVSGGGAGSANVVEVTVNFGASGATIASTVVTGEAWVSATSKIVCSPTMLATADRAEGAEDAVIEGLVVAIHTRVAATGFTVTAGPRIGKAVGRYLMHCTGA